MFTTGFGGYVCHGDSIECVVDGITYTARLVLDTDTRPDEYECYDEKDIDAWKRDEWHYYGVVLSASKCDVELTDYAASLWGIEGNFPGSDNAYFLEVANELLPEAIEAAKTILAKLRAPE